jgi:hypothetical protein
MSKSLGAPYARRDMDEQFKLRMQAYEDGLLLLRERSRSDQIDGMRSVLAHIRSNGATESGLTLRGGRAPNHIGTVVEARPDESNVVVPRASLQKLIKDLHDLGIMDLKDQVSPDISGKISGLESVLTELEDLASQDVSGGISGSRTFPNDLRERAPSDVPDGISGSSSFPSHLVEPVHSGVSNGIYGSRDVFTDRNELAPSHGSAPQQS